MDSLPHLLNISTLATWLSIGGLGTVGVVLPEYDAPPAPRPQEVATQWIPRDFTLGATSSPAPADAAPAIAEPEPTEALPAPPDMPEVADLTPLPEVPEPPPPAAVTHDPPAPRATANSVRTAPRAAIRKPSAAGTSAADGSPGGGAGMSNAARLAAGNMPSPGYPAEARRLGQTGTLTVEFTVDGTGRVISAYAVAPSPWPLLNQEAVRTVRRWRFPPGGGVMKLQRPIVFQIR